MTPFKKVPINANEGKIIYGDGIVDGIVLLAINEIPNVGLYSPSNSKKMKNSAISVRREKDGVHVEVTVKTHYMQSISDVAFKIQETVRHNVEAMTEYRIASVNVIVKGVTFEEKPVVQTMEIAENKEG